LTFLKVYGTIVDMMNMRVEEAKREDSGLGDVFRVTRGFRRGRR
jgi:hypothetical protein